MPSALSEMGLAAFWAEVAPRKAIVLSGKMLKTAWALRDI
jgi:hypothetical protein